MMASPWVNDALSHAQSAFSSKINTDILEVGGGSRTHIPLQGARYTVLDISKEQLERNRDACERILGDAQTIDYGDRHFDACVFWDVLEHLESPRAALLRAHDTLSPGGLVFVKGPILNSAKGIFTDLTPWWTHVLFYRYVLRQKNAGKPGYAPFRVEHAAEASHSEIAGTLKELGMDIVFVGEYVSTQVHALKDRIPPLYWLYEAFGLLLRTVSAGRIGGRETEFLIVAKCLRPHQTLYSTSESRNWLRH
ncbi:UNVERIFIED_ORG: ubiquinone/menaquinone biosynthesis C-methylase UbiE [Rhizobium aethiopicum]